MVKGIVTQAVAMLGHGIALLKCKKPLLHEQQGLGLFCFDDGISIRF